MMALRAHVRGGAERLRYERARRPVPGAGEVLVAVRAAAITYAELGWDLTWTRDGSDRTPIIPSHEFSGLIVGHGDRPLTGSPEVGSEVFGMVPFDRDGAAAEFVSVPVDHVSGKPKACTFAEAAALPLAASTAWQALVDHAAVGDGQRVLITGGAGGVGSLAVQIAVSLGAEVTATALPEQVDFVRGLGAHQVLTRSDQHEAEGGAFDVVLDTIDGSARPASVRFLRRGGRLVTLQAPVDERFASECGIVATFFVVKAHGRAFAAIRDLVETGKLKVQIAGTFPLRDGRAAFESGLRRDRRPGKTVLLVG